MTETAEVGVRRWLFVGRLWRSPGFAALGFLIVGGVVVLQSSEVLDAPKLVYLAIAIVAVAFAIMRTVLERESAVFRSVRDLWIASAILVVVLAVSLPVALANGIGAPAWARDAASYGLFALVPVMAFAAHRDAPRNWLLGLTVLVGVVVTISFTFTWLDRRSIFPDPFERLVLPSGAFASTFFVVASAYSFRGSRHRLLWAIAAGLALGAFLIIGSRSRLPFVVVPVLLGLLAGGGIRAVFPSWVLQYAVAAAVVFAVPIAQGLAAPTSDPRTEAPADVLGRRVTSVDDLVTNPASDPSMRERVSQTVAAWTVFAQHPVLGAGPGLAIEWTNYAGETERSFALDTPMVFVAKFGLVGLAAALAWTVAFARFAGDMLRRIRGSPEWLVLVGEIGLLLYAAIFSPPMQDKGMPFALMLVLALVLRRAYVASPVPVRV